MASPITLRLDEETRRRVARIAKRKRTTTSSILREAVKTWVEQEESALTPYERTKHLIGIVHGGDPGRSERGGRWITQMLKARRKQS